MSGFKREDVLTIAQAMVDNSVYWEPDPNSYDAYTCTQCDASKPDYVEAPIKHDKDCPVLIAQDILTRSDETPANESEK